MLDHTKIENRVIFIFDERRKLLAVSVPMVHATPEFIREVQTAKFLSVQLDTPMALGSGNYVRVTFDDGSETPFVIGASPEDFRRAEDGGRLRFWLPTKHQIKQALVSIYDEELYKEIKARRLSPIEFQRQSIVWKGRATTNIVKRGNEYFDRSTRFHIITDPKDDRVGETEQTENSPLFRPSTAGKK
jgi:hypothetical protein